MKETIDFSQIPHQYAMCLNRECVQANNCLRQVVVQYVPADIQLWTIISPAYLATLEGNCPHHRPAAKVRYARGFIHILENLPYNRMQTVVARLIALFGKRTYYRVRKGERPLSIAEQQQFFRVLKQCGVSSWGEFDAYFEDYDW